MRRSENALKTLSSNNDDDDVFYDDVLSTESVLTLLDPVHFCVCSCVCVRMEESRKIMMSDTLHRSKMELTNCHGGRARVVLNDTANNRFNTFYALDIVVGPTTKSTLNSTFNQTSTI